MKLVQIGTVDVDAGIVMIGDPCYTLPDGASRRSAVAAGWERFREALGDASHAEPLGRGTAIVVRTLLGDGEYPVMAELDARGRIRRLTLDFDPAPEAEGRDESDRDAWDDD